MVPPLGEASNNKVCIKALVTVNLDRITAHPLSRPRQHTTSEDKEPQLIDHKDFGFLPVSYAMTIDDLVRVSGGGVDAIVQILVQCSPRVKRRDVVEVCVKEVVIGACVGRRLFPRISAYAVDGIGHVDLALVCLVMQIRHLWQHTR